MPIETGIWSPVRVVARQASGDFLANGEQHGSVDGAVSSRPSTAGLREEHQRDKSGHFENTVHEKRHGHSHAELPLEEVPQLEVSEKHGGAKKEASFAIFCIYLKSKVSIQTCVQNQTKETLSSLRNLFSLVSLR